MPASNPPPPPDPGTPPPAPVTPHSPLGPGCRGLGPCPGWSQWSSSAFNLFVPFFGGDTRAPRVPGLVTPCCPCVPWGGDDTGTAGRAGSPLGNPTNKRVVTTWVDLSIVYDQAPMGAPPSAPPAPNPVGLRPPCTHDAGPSGGLCGVGGRGEAKGGVV